MRITIDIPDDLHKAAKLHAAQEGTTLSQLVIDGLQSRIQKAARSRKPFQIPVIHSKNPGTLYLTNGQIDDILYSDLVYSARSLMGR